MAMAIFGAWREGSANSICQALSPLCEERFVVRRRNIRPEAYPIEAGTPVLTLRSFA
jgi:hypothetical protein